MRLIVSKRVITIHPLLPSQMLYYGLKLVIGVFQSKIINGINWQSTLSSIIEKCERNLHLWRINVLFLELRDFLGDISVSFGDFREAHSGNRYRSRDILFTNIVGIFVVVCNFYISITCASDTGVYMFHNIMAFMIVWLYVSKQIECQWQNNGVH